MKIIDLRKTYKPIEKQVLAHTAQERFVLYGGAVGGGKSVWLCEEGLTLSLECDGNMGYMCRHELASFMRTTMLTLDRYLPSELIAQHHQTENYYRLVNGSLIYYGGLGDDQRAIDRLKSMELGWFAIDQAEETSESHFFLLASRLRLKAPGVRYKGLLTANPAPGWVKHRFVEQKLDDHIFIPSLPRDNPYLPDDYEATLRELYPEELVKQLLDGDWDALEAGDYLFKYADIKLAIERGVEDEKVPPIIGQDIARFGDDNSVAVIRRGQKVIWMQRWAKTDLMDTTGRVVNLIDRFKPSDVNLDIIGLGSGVYDRLKELKYKMVNPINVSEAPQTKDRKKKERLANLRAEIYKNLAELFVDGEISIPDDLELLAQLSSIKYKFDSHGRLQIESKEDAKKRGVKSPDKADALALAFMEAKPRDPGVRWL